MNQKSFSYFYWAVSGGYENTRDSISVLAVEKICMYSDVLSNFHAGQITRKRRLIARHELFSDILLVL